MSWVSSSTTVCATTLDARAARAVGVTGPAVVLFHVVSRLSHAPRNFCQCRHVVDSEIVERFEYGSLTVIVVCRGILDGPSRVKQTD
jgi:hypothetical protein